MLIALKLDPFGLSYYGGLSFLVFFFFEKVVQFRRAGPRAGGKRRHAGGQAGCGVAEGKRKTLNPSAMYTVYHILRLRAYSYRMLRYR
jgi:hypothetical protein